MRQEGIQLPRFTQKSVKTCSFVKVFRWIVASDRPASRNNPINPVAAVTMPTSPKSFGNKKPCQNYHGKRTKHKGHGLRATGEQGSARGSLLERLGRTIQA